MQQAGAKPSDTMDVLLCSATDSSLYFAIIHHHMVCLGKNDTITPMSATCHGNQVLHCEINQLPSCMFGAHAPK